MRGRRLVPMKGLEIRPTSDRVREAVFDKIGQDLKELQVLDLFAGSGALGIEALSRGAEHAVFVDRAAQALRLIEKNLRQCGLLHAASLIRQDLRRGLPRRLRSGAPHETLVFVDPPYRQGLIPPVLTALGGSEILAPGSLIVAETAWDETLSVPTGALQLLDSRRYGDTCIHLLEYEIRS
jgi:16S rRNA (guanine966-N2)-methyltransferase